MICAEDGPTREALVATAGETIARGSKSFRLASRLFDRTTRERAWLLYAWCRHCDDLCDGQTLGHDARSVIDAQERLSLLRVGTQAALDGRTVGEMPFDALRLVAAEVRCRIAMSGTTSPASNSTHASGGREPRPTCCNIATTWPAPSAA
jgi:hypothetical protein